MNTEDFIGVALSPEDRGQLVREAMLSQSGTAKYVSAAKVARLWEVCPDADILATALLMDPRPEWVREVLA